MPQDGLKVKSRRLRGWEPWCCIMWLNMFGQIELYCLLRTAIVKLYSQRRVLRNNYKKPSPLVWTISVKIISIWIKIPRQNCLNMRNQGYAPRPRGFLHRGVIVAIHFTKGMYLQRIHFHMEMNSLIMYIRNFHFYRKCCLWKCVHLGKSRWTFGCKINFVY